MDGSRRWDECNKSSVNHHHYPSLWWLTFCKMPMLSFFNSFGWKNNRQRFVLGIYMIDSGLSVCNSLLSSNKLNRCYYRSIIKVRTQRIQRYWCNELKESSCWLVVEATKAAEVQFFRSMLGEVPSDFMIPRKVTGHVISIILAPNKTPPQSQSTKTHKKSIDRCSIIIYFE